MKYLVIAFGVAAAAVSVGASSPAHAQNYPWCEYISGGMGGGGRNCGFVSFEQCMASAQGNGGDCRPNTMYEPGAGGSAYQPAHKARKHKHS